MDDLFLQLQELENVQLVRKLGEIDLTYQFKHALAQETTYQSLLVKTRRDIHLLVAKYYEDLYVQTPDGDPGILAYHYFGAGDYLKTFYYSRLAGDIAARLYAHPEALMHYDRALEMLRRLSVPAEQDLVADKEISSLLTNRGRTLELSGQFDLALENYAEMEMLGRARGNPSLELEGLTARAILYSTYTPVMDAAKGREHNALILARAREMGDRAAEAKILWVMSLLAKYAEGNLDHAIEFGELSLTTARDLGLRDLIAFILNDLAAPYGMMGQFDKAIAAVQEASDILRELGNLAMLSDTIANLIFLYYYEGSLDKAEQAYQEALRLSQLTGSLWGQAYSQMWAGDIFAEQGEYGKALDLMQECLSVAEQVEFYPPQTLTRSHYAWLLGEIGLYEQANRQIERAAALTAKVPPFAIFVHILRVRLAVLVGDLTTAETVRQDQVYQAEPHFIKDPDWVGGRALAEAEFALAKQQYARALENLDPAIRFLESHQLVTYLPDLYFLQGHLLELQSDANAALAAYKSAERAALGIPSRRILWKILFMQSEIERKRGNLQTAAELRDRAREIVAYIRDHLGTAEREKSFMSLAPVRALYQID